MAYPSLILLALSTSLFATSARANGMGERGGGDAVVCRLANGQQSVELLDLFEAKHRYKYHLKDFGNAGVRNIYLEVFNTNVGAKVDLSDKSFFDEHRLIRKKSLPNLRDEGRYSLPSHCRLEQLAIWVYEYENKSYKDDFDKIIKYKETIEGSRKFYVNQALYDQLDNANKAALLVHELKWQSHRNTLGSRVSESVRRQVAKLFAREAGLKPPRIIPAAKGFLSCWATAESDLNHDFTSFFTIVNERDKIVFSFHVFRSMIMKDDFSFALPLSLSDEEMKIIDKNIYSWGEARPLPLPGVDYNRVLKISSGLFEGTKFRIRIQDGTPFRMLINGEVTKTQCTWNVLKEDYNPLR